jgi:anthranilate synthase/aminodeoxychorismate synthase-like glutamine amidotransferase
MLLLIDNMDSFTYNIVEAFTILGEVVTVRRSHFTTLEDCKKLLFDYLVIGPGPKSPAEAGISKDLIGYFSGKIPLLGICLGHQAIGEKFGGKIVRAIKPIHGQLSNIHHQKRGIFKNMKTPLKMVRYNSLIIERESLPDCLENHRRK